MENAGWAQRDAAQSIIQNNIYGLDIDDRAAQLSYFAVLMKARQYDRRILTRGIEPNVYAVQESNGINREQLKYFGAGLAEEEKKTVLLQMDRLINTLIDAKEYGSLLNVEDYDWELLEKFVENTDTESQISFDTYGLDETAEQLKQLIRIGKVMAQKYEIVATNPPYMSVNNAGKKVSDYVREYYSNEKTDLYAAFITKCRNMLKNCGFQAMITQHGWMFLGTFENMRKGLLHYDIINMVHLGARAFEEIGGEVVQTTSFVIRKTSNSSYKGIYARLVNAMTQKAKEEMFLNGESRYVSSICNYENIPGSPIAYWISDSFIKAFEGKLLGHYAYTKQGFATGNNELFLRLWTEVASSSAAIGNKLNTIDDSFKWYPCNKGGSYRKWYGNNSYLANWQFDGKAMKEYEGSVIRNPQFYFKEGITWSSLANQLSLRYTPRGYVFESKGSMCFSKGEISLWYILGLLNCKITSMALGILSPTLDFHEGPMAKVPVVNSDNEGEIIGLVKDNVRISKNEWDSYEISWDFKRHPLISVISQNRVVFGDTTDIDLAECYNCWENECNERFNQLKANEEELNRIFIDIYGLQDELSPEVEDKDVTVRKADLQREIKSLISYAVGCMFGRYSLNQEGLAYAGGEWDESIYLAFAPDRDNIIPICDEEYFSDDIVSRFCEWVKIVYGEKSLETNLDFIAKALGNKGNTSREVIRNYFLNDFFKDHCNTYSVTGSGKRPIYWLFDSGKQNGFKALIYMHRYDADTVGRVRTDYLHKAQKYVETAMQSAQYTIDNATSASEKSKATKAVTKYTKQLAEMKIYDEAIAHVANQRIEIDLDDGVKVNYAKFQGVEVAQEGKKALKIDLLAKI
jgi:hypothetical protein